MPWSSLVTRLSTKIQRVDAHGTDVVPARRRLTPSSRVFGRPNNR
jgi:hypothetical protein